jgi:predicted O-methyltransferase YrrM
MPAIDRLHALGALRRMSRIAGRSADSSVERADGDFYGPAVVGAATIGAYAVDPAVVTRVVDEVAASDADAYVDYVRAFVAEGRRRGGHHWRYADITTVLHAAAELLRPSSYLEIGVRRGRSMAVVTRSAPDCSLVGVDFWNPGYAGIDNPGEPHVREIVAAAGHGGTLELLSGDSHVVVPRLFRERPELRFDLITVDGDHSERGARDDLATVLPRLTVGGALVFDDNSHPSHPYLRDVWRRATHDRRYSTWLFDDVGYGVAVAVRRW